MEDILLESNDVERASSLLVRKEEEKQPIEQALSETNFSISDAGETPISVHPGLFSATAMTKLKDLTLKDENMNDLV